ncbi:MAG: sigma-70 family RNA polymerase sigma factor [Akkermansiaceae bacterium]|nr:sigma-70 family RNA polymerase sigma factor [Armatimonadota bacterium]
MELFAGHDVSLLSIMTITDTQTEKVSERRTRFVRLVSETENDLLRTARRLCRGNEEQAQDLMQEVLIRAYSACCKGQWDLSRATFLQARAYLLHTATNQYINMYWRHKKWDAGFTVDELTLGGEKGPPSTHAAPSDVPGFLLDTENFGEDIEGALAALPEEQRLAVYFVDVQGRTYEEAAEAFEIPIGTVRSRLARARNSLRERLRSFAQERRLIP